MKLSYAWLRDWIDLDATPQAVAEAFTRRGFYVEGVEAHGHAYPGVVVARVLEVQRHPNADRLSLCRVDGGGETLSVVCGAPNVKAGMLVPLATVGATLPGGLVIKKSKIRGEESFGMLCSARELQLSHDHEGILDLERYLNGRAQVTIGTPLDRVLDPPDAVLEIEVPFNRPDGLGVVGLAREAKAAFGARWTEAARTRLAARWTEPAASRAKPFDLELEDPEGCPRYIAQEIHGVTIGLSPEWLVKRLESIGQRAINNVVDVTNYVLFELGQPLHAFDLDRLHGPAIRVRRARAGERITTLDGKERALDAEILVIADRDRPVAVAGVMGGADSEVSEKTTRLLLECAWFDPRRVRRGARRLMIPSEAAKRFERGVDPDIAPVATARFLELLEAVAPGCTRGAARERSAPPPKARRIELRTSRIRRVAGLDVAADLAARHLEGLEFSVQPAADTLQVTVPSWRADVTIEDDLVEEVARSVGYDEIPEAPLETRGVHAVRSPRERLLASARRAMLSRGVDEAWCTTLVSEREALTCAAVLGETQPRLVRLANPISRDHEVLRPNLLPGLLRAVAANLRKGARAVRLFELGAVFAWPTAPGEGPGRGAAANTAQGTGAPLPDETWMLAAVLTGSRFAHAHSDERVTAKDSSLAPVDFLAAKGIWEAWLDELRVDAPQWRAYSAPGWKPGASAEVASGTSRIGWAGTLSSSLLREWEIETEVHAFVALTDPLQNAVRARSFTPPRRFPPVRRDLAFFVPASVTHAELERTLAEAAGERLGCIELFDVYAGAGTPQGMKSMAYALEFQHDERTMTEPEVDAIQQRMVAAVAKDHGGHLRAR